MKIFTLEDQEALFIVDQIAGLPNKSNTNALFQKLANQYNSQVTPPSDTPATPPQE